MNVVNIAKPIGPAKRAASVALGFLKSLDPEGWHNLVAINPDNRRDIEGITFGPDDSTRAEAFISSRNGAKNLYFSVNEPRPGAPDKKLPKDDIAFIRAVHVDLDPRTGDLEQERAALLALAKSALGSLPPAIVVDSGGGFNMYWPLAQKIEHTTATRARVEAQSDGIGSLLEGDHTFNVDRILRLPGTVNLPDATKRRKGRTESMATVLDLRVDRFDLDQLEKAYKPLRLDPNGEPEERKNAAIRDLQKSLDPHFIKGHVDYSDLPEGLRERFEKLLRTNERVNWLWAGLEGPNGDDQSTSAWRFSLAGLMKRAGGFTPDEFGALTYVWDRADPDKIDTRAVARDWYNAAGSPDPDDFLEDIPGPAGGIEWIRPSQWEGTEPPPREWEVKDWIPKNEVTLLYGDGGIGKTLLAHQYATAAAAGLPWLGQETRKAKVMCFFCEDSADELQRRQIDINRSLGLTLADTDENLRIAPRKYFDNLMVLWDRQTGAMKRQAIWTQLRDDAIAFGAEVLILDTIADTYSGSEIDRAQVSAFLKSCLGKLGNEIGGTVIALGHPSAAGKSSGSGTSGSTAWSNAVRSRLYLRYPKGVSKGNVRELEGMKTNYASVGSVIKLRWDRGAFAALASSAPSSTAPGVEAAACDALLAALRACSDQRMSMAPNSTNYFLKVVRRREADLLEAFDDADIERAMATLEKAKAVVPREIGRDSSRRAIMGFAVLEDRLSSASGPSGGIFA